MRRYIRHPSNLPIDYQPVDDVGKERLQDVSQGGLRFSAGEDIQPGRHLHLTIRVHDENLEVDGTVMWCRPTPQGYDVGVAFDEAATLFAVRMVEQLCRIEEYRRRVAEEEGRQLSSEQAAEEWIRRYAASFPRP